MKTRWIFISVATLALLVVGGIFWVGNDNPYRLYGRTRREWKDNAVKAIAHRTTDVPKITAELARMKSETEKENHASNSWKRGFLFQMKSGEWMAFTNICGKSNFRIYDLFIGRASDGKWYYSTYHFCIGAIALRMRADAEGQPENMAQFVQEYYLKEFVGSSDECLRKTWPPPR